MSNSLTDKLYTRSGLTPFAFFQRIDEQEKSNEDTEEFDSEVVFVPGAFTSYQSFADFRNQLQAPLVMPIVCLATTLHCCLVIVADALTTAINFVTLNFPQAWAHTKRMFDAFLHALRFTAHAVVDTLSSLLILATRTVATAITGVDAAYGAAAKKLFNSESADDASHREDGFIEEEDQGLSLP